MYLLDEKEQPSLSLLGKQPHNMGREGTQLLEGSRLLYLVIKMYERTMFYMFFTIITTKVMLQFWILANIYVS